MKIVLNTLFIILVIGSNVYCQKKLSIESDIGISFMKFTFGNKSNSVNGINFGVGITRKLYKGFGLVLNYKSINYNKTENPVNPSLVFTNDIANAVYPSAFFQESTNVNYNLPSFGVSFENKFYRKLLFKINYLVSYVSGIENMTRLTAEGNFEPTIVGYSSRERSEISFSNIATSLLIQIHNNIYAGIKHEYVSILDYNNFNLSAMLRI